MFAKGSGASVSKRLSPQALVLGFTFLLCLPLPGQSPTDTGAWRSLFDGKSLSGWKESDFLGAGEVSVENGAVTLGTGYLTGIKWGQDSPPFPPDDFEIRIEAARIKGSDFFAGITFPAKTSYCTWIVGGWGGEVVGLSSINGADASSNETTSVHTFELGRWYTLRLRVSGGKISAWIDDEQVVDFTIGNKYLALREGEIDRSLPFGIASYSTLARIRKIEWRPAK
jgi:3-keto-disaccharide hydrolase